MTAEVRGPAPGQVPETQWPEVRENPTVPAASKPTPGLWSVGPGGAAPPAPANAPTASKTAVRERKLPEVDFEKINEAYAELDAAKKQLDAANISRDGSAIASAEKNRNEASAKFQKSIFDPMKEIPRQIAFPAVQSHSGAISVSYSAEQRRVGKSIADRFAQDHPNDPIGIRIVRRGIQYNQEDNVDQCVLWIEIALTNKIPADLLLNNVVDWVVNGDGILGNVAEDQFDRFQTLAAHILGLKLDMENELAITHAVLAAVLAQSGRQGLNISHQSLSHIAILENAVGKENKKFNVDWSGALQVIEAYRNAK
jgi:hypothetical protein